MKKWSLIMGIGLVINFVSVLLHDIFDVIKDVDSFVGIIGSIIVILTFGFITGYVAVTIIVRI